jgi:uncharacterized membrane protein (DUF485 family)
MAFNTNDQHGLFDDYGTYPSSPYSPRPPHPPRPAHSPPPTRRPSVPAHEDTDLIRLRSAYRWLRRTMTAAVLGYFIGFLCMAAYLPDVMARSVFGSVTLGIFMGLMLIPITLLTIIAYEIFARATVDRIAHRVRTADEEWREREEDGR